MAKNSGQSAYLRQLSTLALPSAALIPAVIDELPAALGSDMVCFNWVDPEGGVTHAHTAGVLPPPRIVERYVRHYVNQDERELGITTRQRVHRPQVISGSRELGRRFVHTRLCSDILAPIGLRHIVTAGVFVSRRLVGTLSCLRAADRREYGAVELRELSGLLEFVGLAAQRADPTIDDWHETADRGTLIIDTAGDIQHADALALHRLYRATRGELSAGARVPVDEVMVRPLRQLLTRLLAIERGEGTTLPELTLQAEGSRFVLTASALRSDPAQPLRWIAVSIAEWSAAQSRVLHWLRQQGLSLRQRELALALFGGASLPEAARRMGVSVHTAEDYLAIVHDKLGVRSRESLLRCLHLLPRLAGGRPSIARAGPTPD